jgi:hemolysin III
MKDYWGYPVLVFIWGLFVVGTIGKIWFFDVFEPYTAFLYIGMGWVCIFSIRTMIRVIPRIGMAWVVGGGMLYTAGCYFFVKKKPFYHAVFHVFMMGGSFCHVMAIGFYT